MQMAYNQPARPGKPESRAEEPGGSGGTSLQPQVAHRGHWAGLSIQTEGLQSPGQRRAVCTLAMENA